MNETNSKRARVFPLSFPPFFASVLTTVVFGLVAPRIPKWCHVNDFIFKQGKEGTHTAKTKSRHTPGEIVVFTGYKADQQFNLLIAR